LQSLYFNGDQATGGIAMNKQQIKGSAKEAAGKLQKNVGNAKQEMATKRDLKTRKDIPTERDREMIRDAR
jgi:hypothetical protein